MSRSAAPGDDLDRWLTPLLPDLFAAVTVPTTVHAELIHPGAPEPVRHWAANPPAWLTVSPAPLHGDPILRQLDDGEDAAITLALSLSADLVLMDDRAGVAVARAKGEGPVHAVAVS